MQQSIQVQERQNVTTVQKARGGLHQLWTEELNKFSRVMGVCLFTPTDGGVLVVKQGNEWGLPMTPINGRDAAPQRIPFTIAKQVFKIDTDLLQSQPKMVGEVDTGDDLYIIVQETIPSRLWIKNAKVVKGDECLKALEEVSPFFMSVLEYARKHRSLSWVSRTATLQ